MGDDLSLSEDASDLAKQAHGVILRVAGPTIYTGGCKAFYTAQEWKERGEDYGTKSVLVIVHDGGDLAPFFNWSYCAYQAMDRMRDELAKIGVYPEQCTGWYSAIYPDS